MFDLVNLIMVGDLDIFVIIVRFLDIQKIDIINYMVKDFLMLEMEDEEIGWLLIFKENFLIIN